MVIILELWLSGFVCLIFAAIYVLYALLTTPSAGQPFGEFMGIVGMSLMLVTEIVYSLRKRLRALQWAGSLRIWLSFHIFTGIVGPFLVLLHSAFAVQGLAGFALTMMGIVVLSGFVGRFIYTAMPRARAGVEVNRDELIGRAEELQRKLNAWTLQRPLLALAAGPIAGAPGKANDTALGNWRTWQEPEHEMRVVLGEPEHADGEHLAEMGELKKRLAEVERQIASFERVHKLMEVWRSLHIPLGIVLFSAALIHVVAALYYKGL